MREVLHCWVWWSHPVDADSQHPAFLCIHARILQSPCRGTEYHAMTGYGVYLVFIPSKTFFCFSDVDWSPFDVNVVASCSVDSFTYLWDIR